MPSTPSRPLNGRLTPVEDVTQYKDRIARQDGEIRNLAAQLSALKVWCAVKPSPLACFC